MKKKIKYDDGYDELGFVLFIRALNHFLRINEGIVVEKDNEKYIVFKKINKESKEIEIGIQVNPKFQESDDEIIDGVLVWMDDDELEEQCKKRNKLH